MRLGVKGGRHDAAELQLVRGLLGSLYQYKRCALSAQLEPQQAVHTECVWQELHGSPAEPFRIRGAAQET